ncbi:O-antigen polymerase [Pectobacterium carotovorum]|uniref:O-antigen polymerase n=1 Tax=Pectobacterium carotovorum TaxID=554 RepID=UPI00068A8BB3|nr:O-antigen polymerase [Pectobacterium carotovorum]MBA0192252.1 oligosaccharide repeat unit polymerase [Pectobacterium carotovorum]MBA0199535.1 oligosaccharide repeat unit polymerase [Pectobacterium carotovorum]
MRLFFLNPFYMFSIAFGSAIFLFQLKISGLYSLSDQGVIQMVVLNVVFFSFLLGLVYSVKLKRYVTNSTPGNSSKFNVFLVFLFMLCGALLEIVASGGVPLFMVLAGNIYNYRDFGIATFHVFFLSYVSASAIIGFERFLIYKERRNLFITIIGVLFSVVIVNRAAMLMIILPCFFLYLSHSIKKRSLYVVGILFLSLILAFGYIGDKRMKSSGYADEKPLFSIAKIDNPILDALPSGFGWFYVYASSPYANLLYQDKNPNYDKGDVLDFLNSSIIPDFISKRIDDTVRDRFSVSLIVPELTVTTGFGWAVAIFGILGMLMLFIYMCFIIILFTLLNIKRHIRSVLALLSTMSVLMIFDNMFIFATCIVQLILISLCCSKRVTVFGKTVNIL